MTTARHANYRKRIHYVIAFCILVIFYTWLGRYAYSPGDAAPGAPAAPHGADSDSRVTARSHGLAAGLRKDVPIFTPSVVRTCHVADPESKAEIRMHTPSSLQEVCDFYRVKLAGAGWKLSGNGTAAPGPTVLLVGEKKGALLKIQLAGRAEGTDIRLRLLPGAGPPP